MRILLWDKVNWPFSRKVCLASYSGSSFLHFIILANRKFSWLEVESLLLQYKPVTFFLLLDECRKQTVQSLPAAGGDCFMCLRAVSMSCLGLKSVWTPKLTTLCFLQGHVSWNCSCNFPMHSYQLAHFNFYLFNFVWWEQGSITAVPCKAEGFYRFCILYSGSCLILLVP